MARGKRVNEVERERKRKRDDFARSRESLNAA